MHEYPQHYGYIFHGYKRNVRKQTAGTFRSTICKGLFSIYMFTFIYQDFLAFRRDGQLKICDIMVGCCLLRTKVGQGISWPNAVQGTWLLAASLWYTASFCHGEFTHCPLGDSSNAKNITLKLIIQKSSLDIRREIALMWMRQNLANEKSTLVQVIVRCHLTTSH